VSKKICYIEYGVYQGYSLSYIANSNKNSDSIFIGLDSFEGLPEDWDTIMPKGFFNTGGKLPDIADKRVKIIKGWFQNTAHVLKSVISSREYETLIVHYDADLYSSTLFALSEIDHTLQSLMNLQATK
jgi:hypothetical protein